MEYKNTKTGATFSSPCVISGGNWIPLNQEFVEVKKESVSMDTQEPANEKPEQIEEKVGSIPDGITKEQIMKELDAFDVKYDKRWGEKRLYDLMMQQGE
ncbi:hypothetical protein I6N96_08930 [Enterococcus sp. BWM-S5]|uniref:Uncharacterized protein n=1 Tax=Enterococcus larvae TaxID=2794352 RepID=A0ABS4CIZ6_9ENTE|nr:hypothetical protein [Enterococcus larvae]MBP1046408.1 hypothetical protein [Enterococcus larvae]